MNGSMDISTIVFALLAIFVVWKLYSVLGTRTGHERPPINPFRRDGAGGRDAPGPEPRGQVIAMPTAASRKGAQSPSPATDEARWQGLAEPESATARGLDEIAKADPAFAAQPFVQGANLAYEHIILAFAKGDREALRPLLSTDVLEGFSAAIASREARGESVETTFVSIDETRIEDARLRGRTAQIAMRFQSKLITVTRGGDGAPVEGDPQRATEIVDVWTFAREIGSPNPNWTLIATESHS